MKKRDEFDSAGEAIGYVSLDQAVLQALRLARQDEGGHLQRLGWDEITWTEASSEQREDFYRVVLHFRPPSRDVADEQTGEEEFVFDLTGNLEFRQVLVWPEADTAEEGGSPRVSLPSRSPRAEALLAQLQAIFRVSREASQYYDRQFGLEPGEMVLLDIPVEFSSVPTWFTKPKGKMGITDRRILLLRDSRRGLIRTELRLGYFLEAGGLPGSWDIEFKVNNVSILEVDLPEADCRDPLVEYLRLEGSRIQNSHSA